jgi:hypothetical protein
MNKLSNLIGNAARLATSMPVGDEVLDWRGASLVREVATWHRSQAVPGEAVLLVDVPQEHLELFVDARSVTLLLSDKERGDAAPVADWRVSRRLLSDAALDEGAVLEAVRSVPSLGALREILDQEITQPWCGSGSIQRIVAPFLLNRGNADTRALALREAARLLEKTGSFETLVLAADEALSPRPLTVCDTELAQFPMESELAELFAAAGLHGLHLTPLLDGPILTVAGVELRLFAASTYSGTKGVCLDQGDAAIYLGPWSSVCDDDGHTYPRGARIAVCAKTAAVLRRAPYAGSFLIIPAHLPPSLENAPPFDCSRDVVRPPAETKGRAAGNAACGGSAGDCGC